MTSNNTSSLTLTLPSEREIVMTRVFDAPRRLVFEAFSKPEHMVRWFGPRKYAMPVCEVDFRVGGAYRFVHRGDDGEFAFRGEYREIVPPERIVWTFEWEGMPGHISIDTLTITEENGKTTMTASSLFASTEDRDGMLQNGMEEGAAESYNRLDELLQTMA